MPEARGATRRRLDDAGDTAPEGRPTCQDGNAARAGNPHDESARKESPEEAEERIFRWLADLWRPDYLRGGKA